MNKAREQFELFSYDETHNISEWDNALWICDCPKIQTELFHCQDCKAEPPGGCRCVYCTDLTILREAEHEREKEQQGKFALACVHDQAIKIPIRL